MQKQRPELLYRYRPFEDYTLGEIADSAVYFTPLTKLDDSLEGDFIFGPSDESELRRVLIERALADGEAEFALLIKFLPDAAIREIEREAKAIGEPYLDAKGRWGVVCFTERLNNKRMWERYAGNGTGMVLEFDTRRIDIDGRGLIPVQYQDERGSTNVVKAMTSAPGGFSEVLSYKQLEWADQEEWRILADVQGAAQLKIPILRVITGPDMSDRDKERVVQAIRQNGRARFAQLSRRDELNWSLHDAIAGEEEIHLI